MKKFKDIMSVSKFEFAEYIIKCLIGASIGYMLYMAFPNEEGLYGWALISIILSITHDNNSKVAYDRMKGNLVGSFVGLVTYFSYGKPDLLMILIGITLVITICFYFKLIGVSRTALVAFVIIVLYEQGHTGSQGWEGAIYRVLGVISGCFIGLLINYISRKVALIVSQKFSQLIHRLIVDEDPNAE